MAISEAVYGRLWGAFHGRCQHAAQWPDHVDEHLTRLGKHAARLRTEITATRETRRALDDVSAAVPVPVVVEEVNGDALPTELQAAVRRRNRAAATCRTATVQAADRYRTALGKATGAYSDALAVYLAELEEAYRPTCTGYVMAAAAACQAAVDGADPLVVVTEADPATVGHWPWLPAAPVTGLGEVDADLSQARSRAEAPWKRQTKKAKGRPLAPLDILDSGARVTGFADVISDYLAGGRLTRLLLRRPL